MRHANEMQAPQHGRLVDGPGRTPRSDRLDPRELAFNDKWIVADLWG
jgi:hypothetical protein